MPRVDTRALRAFALPALLVLSATACGSPGLTPSDLPSDGVVEAAPESLESRTSPSAEPIPTPAPTTPAALPELPPAPAAEPATIPGTEDSNGTTAESEATAPAADAASRSGPRTPAPAPSASSPHTGSVGVADGAALKASAAGTNSADGAVIENVVIHGDLLLTGENQKLRNVRVEGHLGIRGGSGTTIVDSEAGSLSISGSSDITISRIDVFGNAGKDGIHVTSDTGQVSNVVIENSRIHSPQVTSDSHYDGIQVRGAHGLTLRGNSFELGPHKPQFTAAIFLEDANGGNSDVTVTGNYINGGGYAVYLGGERTSFTNNSFGPDARWGLLYPRSDMSSVTTSGNTGPNGTAVAL